MNRTSEKYGTPLSALTYVLGTSEGNEREKGPEKNRQRNNGRELPKSDEKQLIHLRTSINSKQDKYQEIHTQTHHSLNVERQRQRENLESSKRKMTHHIQGNLR